MSAFYTPVFTREHNDETKKQIADEKQDQEPHYENDEQTEEIND